MNDTLTEHKLLILYFLSSVNSSINSSEITNFLIVNNYTDYIQAQQYLGELCDAGLVNIYQTENKVFYKINERGIETLDLFINRLADSFTQNVDSYLKDFRDLSSNTLHTTFDYDIINDDDFNVKCSITKNDKTVFNLEIPDVDKHSLERIKSNWDSNKLNIMKYIKDNLL